MIKYLIISILLSVTILGAKPKPVKIIHKDIENGVPNQNLIIKAKVDQPERIKFLLLHYSSFTILEWKQIPMFYKDGNFSANIPADDVLPNGMIYYIEAIDIGDRVISSKGGKDTPIYIDTNSKKVAKKDNKKNKKKELNLQSELSVFAEIDTQIVTASKKKQGISDAPAIVSVMSRKNIKKMGADNLIDLLKYIPGIEVSMGPDGYYRVSIRGVRKDGNILMLINGQRVNDPYNAKAIYDLPTDFIERVEIIRGPGSALFGTNAVTGIINIFTTEKYSAVQLSFGNNYKIKGNANYTVENRGIKFIVSAGYDQTDGSNSKIKTDNAYEEEWSLTYNDKEFETERWSKYAYLSTQIETDKLNISIFANQKRQGTWAGPSFIAAPDTEIIKGQLLFSGSYKFNLTSNFQITPKLYGDIISQDGTIQETPDNYLSSSSGDLFENGKMVKEDYLIYTLGFDIQNNWSITPNFDTIFGINVEYLSMNDYNLERNYKLSTDEYFATFGNYDEQFSKDQKGKDRIITALYMQGDYRWNILGIVAGFRFDHYSDFGYSINPRAGIIIKPFDFLVLKALYGEAFRAPTFQELYDNTNRGNDGFIGDKNLDPETVRSIEIGFELNLSMIILRGNFFYNMTENLIAPFDENGAGGVGRYANIGSIDSYGLESEIIAVFGKYISIFANVSWLESKFDWNNDIFQTTLAPELSEKDKVLYNFPNFRLNGGTYFTFNNFTIFLGAHYGNNSLNNHRLVLERLHKVDISSYLRFDFSVKYDLSDKISLQITGNRFGEKYSDPSETSYIDNFGSKGLIQPSYKVMGYFTYNFGEKI